MFSKSVTTHHYNMNFTYLHRELAYISRAHSPTFASLHVRHNSSPILPSLHLRHSSFSNPSVASPTSSSFSNPSFATPTSQALHLRHLASRPWAEAYGSPPSFSCRRIESNNAFYLLVTSMFQIRT